MSRSAGQRAGLARKLAATAYEGLLLAALLVLVGFALLPALAPAPDANGVAPAGASRSLYLMSPAARRLSAAVTFAACGAYCIWFWSGGRRTLAMKTWRLALHTTAGGPVGAPTALLRYLACGAGPALAVGAYLALQPFGDGRWALLALAFNYAWALVDRDQQFLQDRLAGTRLAVDPGPAR